jgi:hypothetical protein
LVVLQIYANKALAKEDADQRQKEKKLKEPKDARNLYLAREGLIREGTIAAQVFEKLNMTAIKSFFVWATISRE